MIAVFHTFYIVTRLFLRVISEFTLRKVLKVREQQEDSLSFSFTDSNTIIGEAKFEPGEGILFFPPVYVQRYAVVKNVLKDERWQGRIRKVVDFGCAEFGFLPYLKHIPGVQEVLSVDIDRELLNYYCCRAAPLNVDYLNTRQEPLVVRVLAGSIADQDPRLLGTDAVICIELIEHLYPDTLEAVPYTVFGFIQPLIAIFTTPNSDFNVLFPDLVGFRHLDHKFEWSRFQFEDWAANITTRYPAYTVKFQGIGRGPKGTEEYGCCSQMAIFLKLSHFTTAPIIHPTFQHKELEAEECEETYVAVREYKYPFYVDNRTNEEKILHEAEYYIRMLASTEEYWSDVSIHIPLEQVMSHVPMCKSVSEMRNILKEANWNIVGKTQDDEAVLYPYDRGSESYDHESEYLYCDGNEERPASLQVSDYVDESWDSLPHVSSHEYGIVSSCGITEPEYNVQSQRDEVLEMQDVITHSNDSCKTVEDETHASSDMVQCNSCVVRCECVESVPVSENLTLQHSCDFRTDLKSKDEKFQLLTDFEPELCEQTVIPFVGHTAAEDVFELSEIDETCDSLHVKLSQVLGFETCSDTEVFLNHESDRQKKVGEYLSLCSYSDDHCVNREHHNPQNLEHQVTASHFKTSDINFSSDSSNFNRSTENLSNANQGSSTEESMCFELYLHLMQEIADGCASQMVTSQPLNLSSASPSAQESSQDRSFVESCSFDEQNEKAVDSGYPNSFSMQDMDMDLTPEQVDELTTESDVIVTEDSECYEPESSEESDFSDNNDRPLLQFNHEVWYDPVGLDVENGDVANNNRDREGNNAVALIQAPLQPREDDELVDDAFIPLLAAAEDFDNDNDVILPDDDEAFPHWLLQLLDGMGDVQNYMIPPIGDGAFLMPDEGLGYTDSEGDDHSDNVAASSSSNEMGNNGRDLNYFDIDEFLVPGCSSEGAEPDTNEHNV